MRTDVRFEQLLRSRPACLAVIAAALLLTVGMSLFLREFRLASGSSTMVLEGDDSMRVYEETRSYFTDDDYILVAIQPQDPWTPEGVAMVGELTAELEQVDGIVSVLSPATTPLMLSRADGTVAIQKLTDPEVDLAKARKELTESPVYVRNVISDDGTKFNMLAYLGDPAEVGHGNEVIESDIKRGFQRAVVGRVRDVLAKYRDRGAEVHASGLPTVSVDMVDYIEHDIRWFGWASVAFLLGTLAMFFRRARYVALPVLTCLVVVFTTLGGMVAFDAEITVVTSNVPSLLFIIGMAHSIHLVVAYREVRGADPDGSYVDAVAAAVRHVWTPCLYTALTTCVGFASLYVTDVKPIKHFAVSMAVGVVVAFVVSMFFLPAAMALMPPTKEPRLDDWGKARFLGWCANVAQNLRWLVYAACALACVTAAIGISKLRVDTSFIDYFTEETDVHQGIKWVDQVGGTMTLEVILPGGEDEMFWLEPDNYARIEALHEYFEARPEVGKTMSLVSFVGYGRQIVSARSPMFRNMKPDALWRMLTMQLQQAGESAQLLNDAVAMVMAPHDADADGTADAQMTRVQVRIRETTVDLRRQEFIEDVRTFIAEDERFQEQETIVTGMFQLFTLMLETLVGSQVRSFGVVFIAVGLMFILLLRHVRAGVLLMLPNILPIAMVLGTMGLADITLDLMTIMIASVSLGIAADATIHYVVRYRREIRAGRDPALAARVAHTSIGRAILYTAVTVIAGFLILVFSRFTPTIYFGVLIGVAMVVGIIADLIVLPALLQTFRPFRDETGADNGADRGSADLGSADRGGADQNSPDQG